MLESDDEDKKKEKMKKKDNKRKHKERIHAMPASGSDSGHSDCGTAVNLQEMPADYTVCVTEHLLWCLKHMAKTDKEGYQRVVGVPATDAPVFVGTLCSGYGTIEVLVDKLNKVYREHFGRREPMTIRCRFMCESDGRKRSRLVAAHPHVDAVYTDVIDVAKGQALNVKSGCFETIPKVDILVCGYSCKMLSALTQLRKSFIDTSQPTGATFEATMQVIENTMPKLVMLENVKQMMHKRKMDAVKGLGRPIDVQNARMRAMGFTTSHDLLNAMDFALPQSRPRCWSFYVLVGHGPFRDRRRGF